MSALPKMSSEITLQWEVGGYDRWFDEALPLIVRHWNEVGTFRDVLHLRPDHSRYHRLEGLGGLHILTAKDSGEMVGYFTVLLTPHARDHTILVGSYDNLYVLPEYRRSRLGLRLHEEGMRKLIELGAHILMFGERAAHSRKTGGGYLKRYGFQKIETMYGKVVRDPRTGKTV